VIACRIFRITTRIEKAITFLNPGCPGHDQTVVKINAVFLSNWMIAASKASRLRRTSYGRSPSFEAKMIRFDWN